MKNHYIVTGGAGFVGGHLVQRLINSGCKVTVIDDFSTGNRKRLADLANSTRLNIIQADIRDTTSLKRVLSGADGVFHLAARVSGPDCIQNWLGNHSVNSTALLGVFELLRDVKKIPVVYASSAAVYGNRSGRRCREDMVERPISPYGADKLSCEHHARAFWEIHGLPSIGLRFFNVYGPGQLSSSPYSGVLTQFVKIFESGATLEIHGDGLQSRDFVHVSNVVDALTAAMTRISTFPGAQVCNVCAGVSHSVRDIVHAIAEILRVRPLQLAHVPARAGDIRHSCGDPGYMAKILDIGPFLTLEQGLSEWLGASSKVRELS